MGLKKPVVVDSVDGLLAALPELGRARKLAVGCEGVNLNRDGRMCWAKFAVPGEKVQVYLVDVQALGDKAFHTEAPGGLSLSSLLSNRSLPKLFYDVRSATDALFHQFGVTLDGVTDLQITEVAVRRFAHGGVRFVAPLVAAVERYLEKGLPDVKEPINQDEEFWAARPLESNDAAFKYAAFSVGLLFDLEDALAKDMGDPRGFDFVARYSRQRVEEYKMPAAAPRSRDRAIAPEAPPPSMRGGGRGGRGGGRFGGRGRGGGMMMRGGRGGGRGGFGGGRGGGRGGGFGGGRGFGGGLGGGRGGFGGGGRFGGPPPRFGGAAAGGSPPPAGGFGFGGGGRLSRGGGSPLSPRGSSGGGYLDRAPSGPPPYGGGSGGAGRPQAPSSYGYGAAPRSPQQRHGGGGGMGPPGRREDW